MMPILLSFRTENIPHNRVVGELFMKVPPEMELFSPNNPFGKGAQVIGDVRDRVVAEAVDRDEALLFGCQALHDAAFPEHVVPEIAKRHGEFFSLKDKVLWPFMPLLCGNVIPYRLKDLSSVCLPGFCLPEMVVKQGRNLFLNPLAFIG